MKENTLKYNQAFEKVFGKNIPSFEDFKFKLTPNWDSMAQIALISSIEDAFDIELEFDDIFAFNSYENGLHLLKDKFNIDF